MKIKYVRHLILFLVIVAASSDSADFEVKGTQNTSISTQNNGLNVKSGGSDSNLASSIGGKDQIDAIKNSSLDKNNSSKQIELKEGRNRQTNSNNTDTKGTGEKKKNLDKGSEVRDVHKEKILPTIVKEKIRTEECDSSNQCHISALIACLRVPGNDSPDLSLLVQNKGKGPLNVNISAPDFVWLEKSQIQLQEKEDVKVKVSIKNGGSDNLIVLTAGNGNCTLEFTNLAAHNSINIGADYINLLKQPSFIFLFMALSLIIGSLMICLRKQLLLLLSNNNSSSPKYEKLDIELPVSNGPKINNNINNNNNDSIDGWDNSWNDGWDDEEAPSSLPVTPSLSSQGVSSRRGKKDGWKD